MDVKEAALAAKEYIADLYMPEGAINLGLEEIELVGTTWKITVASRVPGIIRVGPALPWGKLS